MDEYELEESKKFRQKLIDHFTANMKKYEVNSEYYKINENAVLYNIKKLAELNN